MKRKEVLVTGGAGFIGSHLCSYLLQRLLHSGQYGSILLETFQQKTAPRQEYGHE